MKRPSDLRELIEFGPRSERRQFHFESQMRAQTRKTDSGRRGKKGQGNVQR